MADFKNMRKRFYRVDEETTSHEIFAMLNEVGSETESDIEQELNDSDTEFVADDTLLQGDQNDSENRDSSILVPEATIHPAVNEPETEHFEITTPVVVETIDLSQPQGSSQKTPTSTKRRNNTKASVGGK